MTSRYRSGGWFIQTITFFAYQTGSTTTSTMTGVNLQIWDGPPDNPGSAVVWGDTTTNVMTAHRVVQHLSSAQTPPREQPIVRSWRTP